MNEHDAALYAKFKGIEDGYVNKWQPPFQEIYCSELVSIYRKNYWIGLSLLKGFYT